MRKSASKSAVRTKTSGAIHALYVAPNGSDRFSGTLADITPDGRDGPFATIQQARNTIRRLRRGGRASTSFRVNIRGGIHFLKEPLIFKPEDSGTAKAPVVYAAQAGERPVLSGGRPLTKWTVEQVNGKTCWVTDIPEVAAGTWYFTQLFVNGVRRSRTRLPRQGFYRFANLPEGRMGIFTGARSAQFVPGDIQNWKTPEDIEIVALTIWFTSHLRIESVDQASNTVQFKDKALGDLWDEHNRPSRYWVENVFEAMTEPGDWYLDRRAGRLYYLPLPGEEPDNTCIIAPCLSSLVQVVGKSPSSPAAHIRFENLVFRHSEWRLPQGNVGAIQSAFNVPGAVILQNACDCVFYGCEISQVAQYAAEVRRGSTRNQFIACSMFDLGAGGVKVNHERPMVPGLVTTQGMTGLDPVEMGWGLVNKALAVDDPSLVHSRTTISDCDIHHGGLFYPSAIGVWIGDSGKNRVRHNHIHNFNYSGISVGWTWGYTPARTEDNRIEYNHIHDIGHGILSDMGSIYLLGPQPGTVVRGNIVHDVTSNGYGGWGIYPDEGSSWLLIENNITYRTRCGGFHQHYGRDNIIRNNIFALGSEGQIQGHRPFAVRPYRFEHNIVFHRDGSTADFNLHTFFDHNLYWRDGGEAVFDAASFTQWQQRGHDLHSRIADPLLANPDSGNMSLRSDSPALAMGFKPIDVSRCGPRLLWRRPASFTHWPADRETPLKLVEVRLEIGTSRDFLDARDQGVAHIQRARNNCEIRIPSPVCILVRNCGEIPASGQIRLNITPRSVARIQGASILKYRLDPGETCAFDFNVTLLTEASDVALEATPSNSAAMPTVLFLSTSSHWTVQRISQPLTLETLAQTLKDHAPLVVSAEDRPAAEFRLAIAGDQLAILARFQDHLLQPSEMPWSGSSFEIYGASPGAPDGELAQLFLVPAADGKSARGFRMAGPQALAEHSITAHACPIPGGYQVAALIPCSLLKINPGSDRFLFEGTFGYSYPDSRVIRRTSIRGGSSNTDHSNYILVTVEP